MFDLSKHPYFEKYTDEKSGVESYILKERVAELQMHFYFAQPSVTSDGKYLWVVCSNPPAKYRTLALVCLDPENPSIKHFPNAFPVDMPCLTHNEDGVYFGMGSAVYKLTMTGELTKVIEIDPEFIHHRPLTRLFTDASISCDGKYIVLDMEIACKTYVALGDLETGEVKLLNKFARRYNHAAFSTTKPNLLLIDQDWWRDTQSGEYFPIDNRIWLMNTEGTMFKPLQPESFSGRDGAETSHDYWSGDGWLCWSDYFLGAHECNTDTGEINRVWKRPICHSHASFDRRMFVGDQTPYTWRTTPCQTLFYDRETNKEIEIYSSLPCPTSGRDYYHCDPHPQFCAGDSMIVSTTTVIGGRCDVSITPVEPLLEKCRKYGSVVIERPTEGPDHSSWVDDIKIMKFRDMP